MLTVMNLSFSVSNLFFVSTLLKKFLFLLIFDLLINDLKTIAASCCWNQTYCHHHDSKYYDLMSCYSFCFDLNFEAGFVPAHYF